MIKRLSGRKDTKNDDLKNALRNLVNTKVEYNILGKDRERRGIFTVLSNAEIEVQGRGKRTLVTFEFPDKLLQAIKHPSIYVRLNLLVLRGLESKHSIALYESLKDYINLKRLRISTDAFRNLMGVQPGQYQYFTMLRKRVLDKSIQEINEKTDIKVKYDLERDGRKFTAINFVMEVKEKEGCQFKTKQKIQDKLLSLGVKKVRAAQLVKKHDEQYLRANISIVEEQAKKGGIKNVTAYLMKAFETDFRPVETGFEVKTREQEKAALEQQKEAEFRKKKRQKLLTAFEREKIIAIKDLLKTLDESVVKSSKEEFLTSIENNPIFTVILASKGFDSAVIQSQWQKYLAQKYLPEELWDFDAYLKRRNMRV